MAGNLGHHHTITVVVEIDLGDAGEGEIEAGAEHVVGDVHNAAENGQTRAVMSEQSDATGGVADDVIAVISRS